MPVVSCTYVKPLKIVSLCFLVVGFALQAVGITAKQWDGVNGEIAGIKYTAYQNLWTLYDPNRDKPAKAFYVRFDNLIAVWKMQIVYLETSALGLAIFACFILLIASFITGVSKRTKIQITLSILSILGCLVSCGESIYGVKSYLDNYKRILSINAKLTIDYAKNTLHEPDNYKLTWAPYMCIGAGGIYAIVAILLIIDLIISASKRKTTTPVTPIDE